MSNNWKRVIPELSNYKWCIFIGDDDCLMPGFFDQFKRLTSSYKEIKIFNWIAPTYNGLPPLVINTLMMQVLSKPQIMSSEKYIQACFGKLEGIMAPPAFIILFVIPR